MATTARVLREDKFKSNFSPDTLAKINTKSRITHAELLQLRRIHEDDNYRKVYHNSHTSNSLATSFLQKLKKIKPHLSFSQLLKKIRPKKNNDLVILGTTPDTTPDTTPPKLGGYNSQKYKKPNILKKQPKKLNKMKKQPKKPNILKIKAKKPIKLKH